MKSIIITGASRGIGYELALAATREYDYIAICGFKSQERLSALKDKISSISKCVCQAFVGDIGDYEFVHDMVETVRHTAGKIDALVNVAGISHVGLFSSVSPETWNEIMSTNLTSVYNTCHEVVPHMVHEKEGRIVNISSVWGITGASCEVAYSATKGAINSFSKALAKELAPSNVAVNAIAFGAIDTEMNNHLSPEEKQLLCEEIPYGKMATSKEAATFIMNILKMSPYFTGEVVKFDGAWI